MQAVWKGYLKCSPVTIPVKLYTALAKTSLQFHLYHQECGSPIRQERVCPVAAHRRPSGWRPRPRRSKAFSGCVPGCEAG